VSYTTPEEFKAAVGVDDTVDDGNIQRSLDAAMTFINNYCGRVFDPQDTSLAVRLFEPEHGSGATPPQPPFGWFFGYGSSQYSRLYVGDVAEVTAIELDTARDGSFTTSLPAGAWQLYPLNVGQPGVLGNYTEIRLRPNAPYAFYQGHQVRVTARWGWPTADAPPVAVRQAEILLANRYFRRPSAPFGVWEGPQLGTLATLPQNDPDIAQLLEPYVSGRQAPNWVAL
jgi:hypothetical protein